MPIIKVMEATAPGIASMLLKIKAIKLDLDKPFVWSSGWKSPIYCDNRISLSHPEVRKSIKEGLLMAIRENFFPADAIVGVATAGIPQGVLVAEALNMPFAYVRPKPKEHGMGNLIEGKIEKGQRVVVVEDLVSTGGSSLTAAKALREAGAEIMGMVSIFNYGFDIAHKNFYEANISLVSLCDYSYLLRYALEQRYIDQEQVTSLKAWRVDPAGWKR
jgi:orotate phosphoribosyltransferase